MAELSTVARPYAQAVFRLAKEASKLSAWSAHLQTLALIAQDSRMAQVIGNPKFSAGEKSDIFFSLTQDADKELKSFLTLLAKNGRLSLLPYIQVRYEHLKDQDEGIEEALIETAFALSAVELKELLPQLEKHFGRALRPKIEEVPDLLGGFRATVAGDVLDASVRGKLDHMRVELMKN